MQRLDISTFPVLGQSLIEASAGTGKTFTIASLYSRLLLGHQTGLAPLGCDRVLVVTFTNAATEELRGRIRDRIRGNLDDLLRAARGDAMTDKAFAALVEQTLAANQSSSGIGVAESDGLLLQDYNRMADWFRLNLAQMDNASVFTIHGFCQRMLRQFAFDAGVMFSAELVLDSASYLRQACEDVWRNGQYPLNRQQVSYLQQLFGTPEQLQQMLRGWLSRSGLKFLPALDPQFDFQAVWTRLEAGFPALRQQWQALGADGVCRKIAASGLSGTYYRAALLPVWAERIERWLAADMSLELPENLERFGSVYQHTPKHLKKNGAAPEHPLFEAIQAFLDAVEPLKVQLIQHWYQQVQSRYFELLERDGAMSPDDLLRLLDTALDSPGGALLAERIRNLYPVALIDEFQDTDPLQYRIFSRIYPQTAMNDEPVQWGMSAIGDPKQAIYAFRGADIFTYIGARRSLPAERIFTLDTNWRSHSQLVNAVNHLFLQHPAPFVFDQDIPFVAVAAAGVHDQKAFRQLDASGSWQTQSPLQLWVDDSRQSLAAARSLCARQCAAQILALLTGNGRLGDDPVKAGDVAVLVRSRYQASLVQQALSALGIGSVFLSRDSVFASSEAMDLLSWLTAVADPSDERAVRNALATESHGYSASQLDTLLNDEPLWEAELGKMAEYQQSWQRKGIMAALMLWLEHDQRAVQLRCLDQGERRLTNLLHLGELLQQASRRLRGHQALLRWLTDQIFDDREQDEAQLRLETDANLVSIVTIHKSKGLEYPLVFLPFLWGDVSDNNRDLGARYFDEDLGVVVDLDPDDEAKEKQSRDNRAEAMRLLYVALTRPKQGCFIWLNQAQSYKKAVLTGTALGDLLQVETLELDLAKADHATLAAAGIAVTPFPSWPKGSEPLGPALKEVVQAAEFRRSLYDSWRVSSFTSLARPRGGKAEEVEASIDELLWLGGDDDGLRSDEVLSAAHSVAGGLASGFMNEVASSLVQAGSGQAEMFGFEDQPAALPVMVAAREFPKGANAGTCLHSMLEHWDFKDEAALALLVEREMQRYGVAGADDEQRPQRLQAVCHWLQQIARTPLNGAFGSFRLADVGKRQRLDEMEFCLPIRKLRASMLNPLLDVGAAVNGAGTGAEALVEHHQLDFSPVSGYLKGFIDLVVCVDGRYYLLDYKSNYLGELTDDYLPGRLSTAMAAHHYDLQAWLYTLALDVFLRQRLADYDPRQHLGGVFYLFLRGMTADGKTGVEYRPVDLDELQRWQQTLLVTANKESAV